MTQILLQLEKMVLFSRSQSRIPSNTNWILLEVLGSKVVTKDLLEMMLLSEMVFFGKLTKRLNHYGDMKFQAIQKQLCL